MSTMSTAKETTLAAGETRLRRRQVIGKIASVLFFLATISGLVVLGVLLYTVIADGGSWIRLDFFTELPSRFPDRAGIKIGLVGSLWVMVLTALFTFPIGVGAAIYLEEFAPKNRLTDIIQVNVSNLAGVPSIVYGLLGLGIFVELMRLGPTVLAGALTMTLLILPIVIIASQEAIRAVPDSLRQGGVALGATRLQVVRAHVLPSAMPGILTGTILALSRAIGETAPLIVIGAITFANFTPTGLGDYFSVLPLQIYDWTSRPQAEFHEIAAAGIIVLLAVLLTMNMSAILLRNYFEKKTKG